jgi:hypothetical protein
MTENELKAIKARCEAATPGPWEWAEDVWNCPLSLYRDAGSYDEDPPVIASIELWHPSEHERKGGCVDQYVLAFENRADMDLIAAARTDVEALLEEVERLRETLRCIRGAGRQHSKKDLIEVATNVLAEQGGEA